MNNLPNEINALYLQWAKLRNICDLTIYNLYLFTFLPLIVNNPHGTNYSPPLGGVGGGSAEGVGLLFLSLGSNLGDRRQLLNDAIDRIAGTVGMVVAQSSMIETEPWGFQSEHPFLNCCVAVETKMEPLEVLAATQAIEREMGRKQKSSSEGGKAVYHDRPIDIDILMYGDLQINLPELTVPHALMSKRLFVLQPLAEIANDVIVPGTEMSVGAMLRALEAEL